VNKLSKKHPPLNALEYRTKIKTDAIVKVIRDGLVKGKNNQPNRRIASNALREKLIEFAHNTEGLEVKDCPAAYLYRDSGVDLPMFAVEFFKHYIAARFDAGRAMDVTSAHFPMPYDDGELEDLKTGLWYVIKKSHTQKARYSLSCLYIERQPHESGLGNVWKYNFKKRISDYSVNNAGGYIGRNNGQLMFAGAERFMVDRGKPQYMGTQIIHLRMKKNATKLSGVIVNAVGGTGIPSATKLALYHSRSEGGEKPEDLSVTGIYTLDEIYDIADGLGIYDEKYFDESGKPKIKIPNNKLDPDWGMLVD